MSAPGNLSPQRLSLCLAALLGMALVSTAVVMAADAGPNVSAATLLESDTASYNPVTLSATAPFTFLQAGFTQELYAVSPGLRGGLAFAPDGDPLMTRCLNSGNSLRRFDAQTSTLVRGTKVHPSVGDLASNAGCSLTNHPNGDLYSNTEFGITRLDRNTGSVKAGPSGPSGNALSVAVDPLTDEIVYVGYDGAVYAIKPDFSFYHVFSVVPLGSGVIGLGFSPDGRNLFAANRTTRRVAIINRNGTLNREVPLPSEPESIASLANSGDVITSNHDGTMSRVQLSSGTTGTDTVSLFASGGFTAWFSRAGGDGCLYVTQDGARFLDGTQTSDYSIVRLCPGFAPFPGLETGVTLTPIFSSAAIGDASTLTALVKDNGLPTSANVTLRVLGGPQIGFTANQKSDATGKAVFSYVGVAAGTDTIVAAFVDGTGNVHTSTPVTKVWATPLNLNGGVAPSSISVTLMPGQSTAVDETITLPGLLPAVAVGSVAASAQDDIRAGPNESVGSVAGLLNTVTAPNTVLLTSGGLVAFTLTARPIGCAPIGVSLSPSTVNGLPPSAVVTSTETISVLTGVAPGTYRCVVQFAANDTLFAGEQITVRVPNPGSVAPAAVNRVVMAGNSTDVAEAIVVPGGFGSASSVAVDSEPSGVLLLGGTISGGTKSMEAKAAIALGQAVTIVDDATWSGMTASQFAQYRAIILGDPTCYGPGTSASVNAAAANAGVWGRAINGNILIIGTDPVYHGTQGPGGLAGADLLVQKGIGFAMAADGKTGAYISLSCYYDRTLAHTPVPLLDAFKPNSFSVTGVGCYQDVHIVATHPALAGLTDAALSNWNCSVHEAFDKWPVDFAVLAMAKDTSSTYVAPDGTVGVPYIIARGEKLAVISSIALEPLTSTDPVGSAHTVTAHVVENGQPVAGTLVIFRIVDGPAVGLSNTALTASDGAASFTYYGFTAGEDLIEASYVSSIGATQSSNVVSEVWTVEEVDITARPVGCAPLVIAFDPPSFPHAAAGSRLAVIEHISVPLSAQAGTINCLVQFLAGGSLFATESITVLIWTPAKVDHEIVRPNSESGNAQDVNKEGMLPSRLFASPTPGTYYGPPAPAATPGGGTRVGAISGPAPLFGGASAGESSGSSVMPRASVPVSGLNTGIPKKPLGR